MKHSIMTALVCLTLAAVAVLWWKGYVVPNDALRQATAACVEARGATMANRRVWGECYRANVQQAGGIMPLLNR